MCVQKEKTWIDEKNPKRIPDSLSILLINAHTISLYLPQHRLSGAEYVQNKMMFKVKHH